MPPGTTYFWSSHSRLSSGHTFLVLSQREMQWKWNACCRRARQTLQPRTQSTRRTLQMPHAAVHSSLVAETWFAWQSMPARAAQSARDQAEIGSRKRTEVHDVVPANRAVVHDDV